MVARMSLALRKLTQRLTLLLFSSVLLLGLMQTSVQAAPANMAADPLVKMTPEKLEQKRAQRRELQSEASQAADTEEKADSVGEAFGDKLNLEEIAEENPITNNARKAPAQRAFND